MRRFFLALLMVFSAAGANADIISADFKTASDLPYCCSRVGPVTQQAIGKAVGAGFEIDGSTPVSNPSGWGGGIVHVDLDPVTGLLTLVSQDIWDFESFVLTIDNMHFDAGQRLNGLSYLSGELTSTGLAPQLSFTSDSLRIAYDNHNLFYFTGGKVTFQLDVGASADVPEPATASLFGLAFVGLAWARRRKA
jgi:PEP-CTERM motif